MASPADLSRACVNLSGILVGIDSVSPSLDAVADAVGRFLTVGT